mmetsp:Transcript_18605/g.37300  ORF Transcript_18605/g.37300 Transcript_18605/m.37300 type:complete len:203 (+) Transcript_18605:82-690(+)
MLFPRSLSLIQRRAWKNRGRLLPLLTSRQSQPQPQPPPPRRSLSSGWSQRGHDLTFESLTFGNRPKCILQGYGPSGFDVFNVVKKIDPNEESDGTIHMHGSIMAFPHGCFLWNVETAQDVTLESLAPIFLHNPFIEILFLGCDSGTIPSTEMNRIRLALQERKIVLEKKRIPDCIGHFNILNAEDRPVAVALVINPNEDSYD